MREVTRLPVDTGVSGWNAVLDDYQPAQQLREHITADWLIIGAGFAGLSAARRLAQLRAGSGERIVVLEAKRVGEGPAGRNSGFMIDLPHDLQSDDYVTSAEADKAAIEQNRHAIKFAQEAVEEFGMPLETTQPIGKINAAATAKGDAHNKAYLKHLRELGEASELYDAGQMAEITGSDFFISGLYSPGCTLLQPAMYVRGLAKGLAEQQAVSIYEQSPVINFEQTGKDWICQTPNGSVTAPSVVLAVNGHANSFGFYPRQLMHIFTYASMTRALTDDEIQRLGGEPVWGATSADPMGSSLRRISGVGGHRLLVRNRVTYDPKLEVTEQRVQKVAADHDRSFQRRWPQLKGVEMEYRWGGRLCLSRNGVSAFGELEPGLISAVCQNGLGTTKGTFAGVCAAELAGRANTQRASTLVNEAAPQTLPPEPLATIGANALLRFKEWRAGKEM